MSVHCRVSCEVLGLSCGGWWHQICWIGTNSEAIATRYKRLSDSMGLEWPVNNKLWGFPGVKSMLVDLGLTQEAVVPLWRVGYAGRQGGLPVGKHLRFVSTSEVFCRPLRKLQHCTCARSDWAQCWPRRRTLSTSCSRTCTLVRRWVWPRARDCRNEQGDDFQQGLRRLRGEADHWMHSRTTSEIIITPTVSGEFLLVETNLYLQTQRAQRNLKHCFRVLLYFQTL